MGTINGWNEDEIRLLGERTAQPREAIIRFCQAIDKQLYLLLPTHIKKATLHFHLRIHTAANSNTADASNAAMVTRMMPVAKSENIVRLQDYRERRKA